MKPKTILSVLLLSILFSIISNASVVTVNGRNILVDGVEYTIKGVCYNPVPVGSSERDFSNLTEDIVLMQEAGINTVRVYSPITEESVFDELADAGIMVIVSFGYNQGGNYDILSGTYLDYVEMYKDHDAIFLWELGNEYNYHPEWFGGDIANWYTAMNNAADEIHFADPDHPVSTAHGELPDATARNSCPNIDVWGMNVYRWDNPGPIYGQWSSASTKPMYLSEAGADSYMAIAQHEYEFGPNEQMQADAVENILSDVFDNTDIGAGVLLFSFVDEWWKYEEGNNSQQDPGGSAPNSSGVPFDGAPNEEYWGILNIDRSRKLAFDIVKNAYNPSTSVSENLFSNNEIIVGPNPATDFLRIERLNDGVKNITILDLTGRIHLLVKDFASNSVKINTGMLKQGIYFLKVSSLNSEQVYWFIKN
ncbi:MAG: T9SS type A sorting domain-containing protein [Bacteroidales bacterium]|nr:T9SS type A sorting domain-containing protein [Bacteroidales bacterium]